MYLVSVLLGDTSNCLSLSLKLQHTFSVPCSNSVVVIQEIKAPNGSEHSDRLLALKICSSVSTMVLATNRADKIRFPCLTLIHTPLAHLLPADTLRPYYLWSHINAWLQAISATVSHLVHHSASPPLVHLCLPHARCFLPQMCTYNAVTRVQPQNADGGCLQLGLDSNTAVWFVLGKGMLVYIDWDIQNCSNLSGKTFKYTFLEIFIFILDLCLWVFAPTLCWFSPIRCDLQVTQMYPKSHQIKFYQ